MLIVEAPVSALIVCTLIMPLAGFGYTVSFSSVVACDSAATVTFVLLVVIIDLLASMATAMAPPDTITFTVSDLGTQLRSHTTRRKLYIPCARLDTPVVAL